MNSISIIKKIAASAAIAGSLGLGAVSLGTAIAAAAPSSTDASGLTNTSSPATSGTEAPSVATGSTGRATAEAGTSQPGAGDGGGRISGQDLLNTVNRQTAQIQGQLKTLQSKGDNLTVSDMFEMQMLMNKQSQLSEMSSSVMAAIHSSIMSPARAIKG